MIKASTTTNPAINTPVEIFSARQSSEESFCAVRSPASTGVGPPSSGGLPASLFSTIPSATNQPTPVIATVEAIMNHQLQAGFNW